jgi:hypothetical protein
MKRWLWEYRYYDQTWSSQSCFAPWSIWHLFPDSVHIGKKKNISKVTFFSKKYSSAAKLGRNRFDLQKTLELA